MLNQNLLLAGDDAYLIQRSLRFRSSASAYLSRSFGSGNRKTWTYSAWVKRGTLGARQALFGIAGGSDSLTFFIGFDGSDRIEIDGHTLLWKLTNAVYRDPSAWYHIVLSVDTTQGTASNRIKLYVNNVQVTSFGTSNDPSSSADLGVNQAATHYIGQMGSTIYHDGYHADINFIDGQALTPSSFGETDAQTGVWQPKKYAGTYGTNGFYLPFTDVATTSGSNAGLGKDFSGNGNYWNTNNISVTAGATYDSMTDVPTLTSATAANYAVLNSAIRPYPSTEPIIDGNLKLSCTNAGVSGSAWATIPVISGKWYWEATVSTVGVSVQVGVSNNEIYAGLGTYTGAFSDKGYAYRADGAKILNGVSQGAYGASYTSGDVIGVALDADSGSITFYKNGTSQGVAFSGTSYTGGYFFGFMGINGSVLNANFGQRPFSYAPPTGFKALNTFNLPTPTIGATASSLANKHFDASLWTGNNTSQSIVNSGGFQPDLVWTKGRSAAWGNFLHDSVRGFDGTPSSRLLLSDSTSAEITTSPALVSSINSNGFTVGANGNTNSSGATYVAWQWKANGSAVSNTAGSITSQVSANASAGFSVVTYTGNGVDGATIGHGLGVAPKMIITKRRNTTGDWYTYHASLGTGYVLVLQGTNGQITTSNSYKTVSSSTYAIGTNGDMNTSGGTFVAYCFSEVAGYSKFGSYTGNGSADGTFVHLGFRPKFVITKVYSSSGYNWNIYDSSRATYNQNSNLLVANASGAEETGYDPIDFLSNGFKLRMGNRGSNVSGESYIYMAFAETPFKYANGR